MEAKLVQVAGEVEIRDRDIDNLWSSQLALKEALKQETSVLQTLRIEHHQTRRTLQLVQVFHLCIFEKK